MYATGCPRMGHQRMGHPVCIYSTYISYVSTRQKSRRECLAGRIKGGEGGFGEKWRAVLLDFDQKSSGVLTKHCVHVCYIFICIRRIFFVDKPRIRTWGEAAPTWDVNKILYRPFSACLAWSKTCLALTMLNLPVLTIATISGNLQRFVQWAIIF